MAHTHWGQDVNTQIVLESMKSKCQQVRAGTSLAPAFRTVANVKNLAALLASKLQIKMLRPGSSDGSVRESDPVDNVTMTNLVGHVARARCVRPSLRIVQSRRALRRSALALIGDCRVRVERHRLRRVLEPKLIYD